MDAIEARYGVDGQVVLAIWGMETNYGSYRGDIPAVRSLATLAYHGRRRAWAEEELVAALRILQAGEASPAEMRGSWAGAMGHTQFIPSSYLAFAVDFTGDGRRDIWGPDPRDALASTANYLAAKGWRRGQPWGLEVRLPAGFDYAQADQANRQPVRTWRARGVTLADGRPLPDHGAAALLAPAGARGPVFAVWDNFFVIKTYNNATSYALGVGHLGDRHDVLRAGQAQARGDLRAPGVRPQRDADDVAFGPAGRLRQGQPGRGCEVAGEARQLAELAVGREAQVATRRRPGLRHLELHAREGPALEQRQGLPAGAANGLAGRGRGRGRFGRRTPDRGTPRRAVGLLPRQLGLAANRLQACPVRPGPAPQRRRSQGREQQRHDTGAHGRGSGT